MFRTALAQAYKRRAYSTSTNVELDNWMTSSKELMLSDAFHLERVSDLYITLPTRDGTRVSYEEPQPFTPLGYGHHLAFFHPRAPEVKLRPDGTENDFCPPAPFTRRMWAGGKIMWNNNNPLTIGGKATANCSIGSVEKKGFEEGGNPKVFVKQRIELAMAGKKEPSVIEERSHVYLSSATGVNRSVREGALPCIETIIFIMES
jgi:hydroxyacyl-ACP dehydratase HTD2-like protein with hotdog domain